jgi:hypothetical protein
MLIAGGHLAYCLNVHRGESWDENLSAIREHALRVREMVAPGERWGLGLRIGNQSALELENPARLAEARELFAEQNVCPFTINGFPFGRFHAGRVKENVYAPDWRSDERREYTVRLARILAALLPEGCDGSISTVPGSFKPWVTSDADVEEMVRQLCSVAAALAEIEEDTGRLIHVGLEPEPSCFLETIGETTAFFEEQLFVRGRRFLGKGAEDLLRRHIGVCLDTCHSALQWEDPGESLREYERRGILVSKVQISAALEAEVSEESVAELRKFCEPVYLHQVKLNLGGEILSWIDLEEGLRAASAHEEATCRVHFHVPLYHAGIGALRSTSSLLSEEFWRALMRAQCRHWEIETYTWDVLPSELRTDDIASDIAKEWRWVSARINEFA